MDMSDASGLRFNKGELSAVAKKRRAKLDEKNERACREITRKRDHGKCRIPGCKESAHHLHHITYRSKSKARRWLTGNCVWLCMEHHRLIHDGIITVRGDADAEIIVEGDTDRLRFRL